MADLVAMVGLVLAAFWTPVDFVTLPTAQSHLTTGSQGAVDLADVEAMAPLPDTRVILDRPDQREAASGLEEPSWSTVFSPPTLQTIAPAQSPTTVTTSAPIRAAHSQPLAA